MALGDFMTIGEIKKIFDGTEMAELPGVLMQFGSDSRAGVKKLVEAYKKRYEKAHEEAGRLEAMLCFERRYRHFGFVCGVDEAGAGPFAGPVSAAAVILPENCIIEGLDDSKKLSEKRREELYAVITERAVAYGVAFVENGEIDEINILQARHKAMMMAVEMLDPRPDFILFDGNNVPATDIPNLGLIEGESKSASIAAASILAKVERDRLMMEYHRTYPQYGFDRNKGYGTAEHIGAINKYGLTPIHRRSFVKGW